MVIDTDNRYRMAGTAAPDYRTQMPLTTPVEHPVVETTDEARQGVTGHGVRYVLVFGLILGGIALGVAIIMALTGVFGDASGTSVIAQ